jgi:hypothetical protein
MSIWERRLEKLKMMIEVCEYEVEDCADGEYVGSLAEGKLRGLRDALKVMTGEWDKYLDV